MNYDSVMPIGPPMMPAPTITSVVANAEANSEEQGRAVIPNARIRIPTRPGDNRTSIDDPGIVCRNIDDVGADRLDLDVRTFCSYGLLR